jgi:hypothetical protein
VRDRPTRTVRLGRQQILHRFLPTTTSRIFGRRKVQRRRTVQVPAMTVGTRKTRRRRLRLWQGTFGAAVQPSSWMKLKRFSRSAPAREQVHHPLACARGLATPVRFDGLKFRLDSTCRRSGERSRTRGRLGSCSLTMRPTMCMPKPARVGGLTGGPPLSVQRRQSCSPSPHDHAISTRPLATPALVN